MRATIMTKLQDEEVGPSRWDVKGIRCVYERVDEEGTLRSSLTLGLRLKTTTPAAEQGQEVCRRQ